jgi:hypothetical protein
MPKQKTTSRLDANIRGYLACLLDQSGSVYYNRSKNELVLNINRVKDPALHRDLYAWMGGWLVASESDGTRRGCTQHCKHPHIGFSRMSAKWQVTGTRALFVLSTLEPSLRTWNEKFRTAYNEAVANGPAFPEDVFNDMVEKGWDQPL